MATAPWIVSDELWALVEPLLPKPPRRFRYPGRKRLPDRQALCGILFVLHTGIAWRHLPLELGFGSRRDLPAPARRVAAGQGVGAATRTLCCWRTGLARVEVRPAEHQGGSPSSKR